MTEITDKLRLGLHRHNCEDLVLLCGIESLREPAQLYGRLISIFRHLRDLQEGPVLDRPLRRLEDALIPRIVYLIENFELMDQPTRNRLLDELLFICQELAPAIQGPSTGLKDHPDQPASAQEEHP